MKFAGMRLEFDMPGMEFQFCMPCVKFMALGMDPNFSCPGGDVSFFFNMENKVYFFIPRACNCFTDGHDGYEILQFSLFFILKI